jgi:hypothetical protein
MPALFNPARNDPPGTYTILALSIGLISTEPTPRVGVGVWVDVWLGVGVSVIVSVGVTVIVGELVGAGVNFHRLAVCF